METALCDANESELSSWYNKYLSNIIHLIESIEIETIYGMPSYRLLKSDEYKEFASLFATPAPEFRYEDL